MVRIVQENHASEPLVLVLNSIQVSRNHVTLPIRNNNLFCRLNFLNIFSVAQFDLFSTLKTRVVPDGKQTIKRKKHLTISNSVSLEL